MLSNAEDKDERCQHGRAFPRLVSASAKLLQQNLGVRQSLQPVFSLVSLDPMGMRSTNVPQMMILEAPRELHVPCPSFCQLISPIAHSPIFFSSTAAKSANTPLLHRRAASSLGD